MHVENCQELALKTMVCFILEQFRRNEQQLQLIQLVKLQYSTFYLDCEGARQAGPLYWCLPSHVEAF